MIPIVSSSRVSIQIIPCIWALQLIIRQNISLTTEIFASTVLPLDIEKTLVLTFTPPVLFELFFRKSNFVRHVLRNKDTIPSFSR